MNRQNSIKKFVESKRPRLSFPSDNQIDLDIEFRHNDQMAICHEDLALDYLATWWTAAKWTTNNAPEHKIHVATFRGEHASWLMRQTIENIEEFDPDFKLTRHNAQTITNDKGGIMRFSTIGNALAGHQFDQIIINDAKVVRSFLEDQQFHEWLEHIRCRLVPR